MIFDDYFFTVHWTLSVHLEVSTVQEFSSRCKFARDHFSLLKFPQQAGGAYLRGVVSCELHVKGISQVCLE